MINRYTYTAREYDSETGLYYYRARYYDPKAGRFITRDPIGFKGGINQYAYVFNNPIKYTDPEGLFPGPCGNENHKWVPDKPLGFNFTWPCTEHDSCYGCAGAKAGKSKAMCDLDFFGRMSMTCAKYPFQMSECMQMAVTYYIAVNRGANDAFTDARKCCDK
ncbi:MAG: repeat protein [Firmicutes bacterium]|nr:repeat protein [Bacillota bacterium]